jgi:hypothetical protein
VNAALEREKLKFDELARGFSSPYPLRKADEKKVETKTTVDDTFCGYFEMESALEDIFINAMIGLQKTGKARCC